MEKLSLNSTVTVTGIVYLFVQFIFCFPLFVFKVDYIRLQS